MSPRPRKDVEELEGKEEQPGNDSAIIANALSQLTSTMNEMRDEIKGIAKRVDMVEEKQIEEVVAIQQQAPQLSTVPEFQPSPVDAGFSDKELLEVIIKLIFDSGNNGISIDDINFKLLKEFPQFYQIRALSASRRNFYIREVLKVLSMSNSIISKPQMPDYYVSLRSSL